MRLMVILLAAALGCQTLSLLAPKEPTTLAECQKNIGTELLAEILVCDEVFSGRDELTCKDVAQGAYALALEACKAKFPPAEV